MWKFGKGVHLHRIFILIGVVAFASLMTGFFHMPPEFKVKSLKQITGRYEGSFTTSMGREVDGIVFIINEDGTYVAKTPRGERPGKVHVKDGKLVFVRDMGGGDSSGTIRENKKKRLLITSSERGDGQYEFVK